jgi:hypothetical protein
MSNRFVYLPSLNKVYRVQKRNSSIMMSMKICVIAALATTLLEGCSGTVSGVRNTCGNTGQVCSADQTCTELIEGTPSSRFCKPNSWKDSCDDKCKSDEICINSKCQSKSSFGSCTADSDCGKDGECMGNFCFPKVPKPASGGNYYTNGKQIYCSAGGIEISPSVKTLCEKGGLTCKDGDNTVCASNECRCYPKGSNIFSNASVIF